MIQVAIFDHSNPNASQNLSPSTKRLENCVQTLTVCGSRPTAMTKSQLPQEANHALAGFVLCISRALLKVGAPPCFRQKKAAVFTQAMVISYALQDLGVLSRAARWT